MGLCREESRNGTADSEQAPVPASMPAQEPRIKNQKSKVNKHTALPAKPTCVDRPYGLDPVAPYCHHTVVQIECRIAMPRYQADLVAQRRSVVGIVRLQDAVLIVHRHAA